MSAESCKITFGKLVRSARKSQELSQKELCKAFGDRFQISLQWFDIVKIENDRVDIRCNSWNWFVQCFCEMFDADPVWVDEIRQKTELSKATNLANGIFPVYFKDLR